LFSSMGQGSQPRTVEVADRNVPLDALHVDQLRPGMESQGIRISRAGRAVENGMEDSAFGKAEAGSAARRQDHGLGRQDDPFSPVDIQRAKAANFSVFRKNSGDRCMLDPLHPAPAHLPVEDPFQVPSHGDTGNRRPAVPGGPLLKNLILSLRAVRKLDPPRLQVLKHRKALFADGPHHLRVQDAVGRGHLGPDKTLHGAEARNDHNIDRIHAAGDRPPPADRRFFHDHHLGAGV
jgi:hypothetical protein